ncbi:hypothetical protein ACIOZM_13545 [Pseudomonas sp. NPDC087346]|uniref:hypothetical protein n=1 Tax=Pseudomonas sp. NPDC087346 TaxID=3364438 RepID=UPI003806E88D
MSTDQEKSFIATFSTQFGKPHFPGLTYGRTIKTPNMDYAPFRFESHMDVSNYLFLKPEVPANSLTFYFRCLDDYYTIYIFTKGTYYYQTLSNEEDDFLNPHVPHEGDQTTFNLLSKNGKVITLDDLATDTPTIRIRTRGGKVLQEGRSRRPYDPVVGTAVRLDSPSNAAVLDFKLNILQRNAPY